MVDSEESQKPISPEWQDAIAKYEAKKRCYEPLRVITNKHHPEYRDWVIVLNKYQRDNLLWLLAAVGGAKDAKGKSGIAPFTFAMNGDWAGEIPIMLKKPEQGLGRLELEEDDRPNGDLEALGKKITAWRWEPAKKVAQILRKYIPADSWAIILTKVDAQIRSLLADTQKTPKEPYVRPERDSERISELDYTLEYFCDSFRNQRHDISDLPTMDYLAHQICRETGCDRGKADEAIECWVNGVYRRNG
jgi:hypothetical protein